MTQTLSMSKLYQKLSAVGLKEVYVREFGLPSWWSDELNHKAAAVLEGAGYISTRLNLDLASLLKDDQEVRFKSLPRTKFKYHNQAQSDIPNISHQLASRIAELVAHGIEQPYTPLPTNCNQMRREILQSHPKVNLKALLDYCWQHGIAVIYFNKYPQKARKITAMIQWQSDRPVIVLSGTHLRPARLAFHLAHELAHLALGHVEDGIRIDDDINPSSTDSEEQEANQMAVELLVEQLDNCFRGKSFFKAIQLEKAILGQLESDSTVDACVLAYNYAWHAHHKNKQAYGQAEKAIQRLDSSRNGDVVINQFLEQHIDWDVLSDDSIDHLESILGD